MFTTFDAVFYTLAFLVPGFLIDYFVKKFIPKKDLCDEKNLLYYLCLSCLNYAVWSWLIYIMYRFDRMGNDPVLNAVLWGAIILIGPMIVSLILLLFNKFKLVRRLGRLIGFAALDPIPTAWDYIFSRLEAPKWVIVMLENDQYYAGLWNGDSFASSETGERDIYLQEVYRIKEDGSWEKVNKTRGIYIKGDQIKSVQFFDV